MRHVLTYGPDAPAHLEAHLDREIILVERPDRPTRHLLIDAPRWSSRTDDVVIIDDAITTFAEARLVASGWVGERRQLVPDGQQSASLCGHTGTERELARYRTSTGALRAVVGQRVRGRVCVTDRPTGGVGRVLVVERDVVTRAELDALVSLYVAESTRRGEPARRPPDDLIDKVTDSLTALS
jgi:hypothetical protein